MTSLNRLVRERDLKHNSSRQLEVTERPRETKRICVLCRKIPVYAQYRAKWLAANPRPALMPMDFPRSRYWEWGDDLWCARLMPEFLLTKECPECGADLVSVTW